MRPLSFLFVQFWRWTYPSKAGPLGRKGVEGRQLSYTAALKILEKLYTSVHCTTLNGVYPMCSLKTQTMFFPPKEKGNFLVFGDQIVTSGVYIRTLLIIWAPAGCHDGWWVGTDWKQGSRIFPWPEHYVAWLAWQTGNDMNSTRLPIQVFIRVGLVDAWQGGGADCRQSCEALEHLPGGWAQAARPAHHSHILLTHGGEVSAQIFANLCTQL